MTSIPAEPDDAALVAQTLAGDRSAFTTIVARYQTLVCALAYSATGSRSRSEDLAQETFVAAWKHLGELRKPERLRGWICGIARNVIHSSVRQLHREPVHDSEALDLADEMAAQEPQPTTEAIRHEEMALLWRELVRLPEKYREPLVLYYREHKSVEHVAAALGLSTDAVMQRLSRGRRLLQERMLAFVETTLERTNPGKAFTLQVTAALPFLAGTAPTVAAASVTPGAAAQGGLLKFLLAWVLPFVGVFAAIGISWSDIKQARHPVERRLVLRYLLGLWLSVVGFVIAMPVIGFVAHRSGLAYRKDWLATAPYAGLWFTYTMVAITLIVRMIQARAALRRRLAATNPAAAAAPAPTAVRGLLTTIGVLTAVYWLEIVLAWRSGDRVVAILIALGVAVGGAIPLWLVRRSLNPAEQAGRMAGTFLAISGLVFLAILNWRLHAWLAPIFRTDPSRMAELLPMPLVHLLTLIVISWTWFLARRGRDAETA